MASIKTRTTRTGDRRYDVRYRTPAGKVTTRTFARRRDADKFAATIEADKARGDWLDPTGATRTFDEWAATWRETTSHLRPSTLAGYTSALEHHLAPRLGSTPLAKIDHPTVVAILSDLTENGAAPGSVAQVRHVLRSILGLAVKSGAIRHNPVQGARIPRATRKEMHFLTPEQVADLAAEVASGGRYPTYGLLVRFTAWTGLRAGEVAGLRVGRLDLMRRRVHVAETLTEVRGQLHEGPTKSYENRAVPVPSALCDELAELMAGRGPDEYVFTSPDGGPMRHTNFYRRHYKPAVLASTAPNGARFHDLRHTYAAFLVAQGAPPVAVMRRLGHSTIVVTMNTYGHVFPEMDEQITDGIEDLYNSTQPTPRATVHRLG